MWQSKKLIKIAEKKVDKENKEREVTLPPMRKKMLGQYAHVESVLKRERVKEEDTRVNAAERRADEEAEARMAAERVAEAVKEKQRIQEVCDLAETLRMTAEARASEARSRMLAAESKCAPRNSARNSGQFSAHFSDAHGTPSSGTRTCSRRRRAWRSSTRRSSRSATPSATKSSRSGR